jgi:hypothetical protein
VPHPASRAECPADGRCHDLRIIGVQDQIQLRGVQVLLVRCRCGRGDAVGVVEKQAEVAQSPDTGLGAHRWQPDLDPRIAEGALFGFAGLVVEVDLLVRAPRHTLPPTPATILVDQDDAIFGPFVDGAGWAGSHTGRVQAVLTNAWQVEHERLLERKLDLVLGLPAYLLHDRIEMSLLTDPTKVVVPVRRPGDLGVFAGDQ